MENVRKGKGIEKRNKQGQGLRNLKKKCEKIIFLNGLLSLVKKISYLFPRAHAVAYVMMAFHCVVLRYIIRCIFTRPYFSIRAKAFDLGS